METPRTTAQYNRNDRYNVLYENEFYLSYDFFWYDRHDRYNDMETRAYKQADDPLGNHFKFHSMHVKFSQIMRRRTENQSCVLDKRIALLFFGDDAILDIL